MPQASGMNLEGIHMDIHHVERVTDAIARDKSVVICTYGTYLSVLSQS